MKTKNNLFIRQILKFLSLKLNLIMTLILIIVFVLLYFANIFGSNNGNVTWIFSSSMQTLAALIALLPISYSYYLHNIEAVKGDNYDNYIIKKLEKDVYHEMMFVIIYSLVIIIFNLINLYLIYTLKSALFTAFLTVLAIQFLVVYIYRLFDPERVNNILKDLDKTVIDPYQKKVSLDLFITQYLDLETAVKDYISNGNDNEMIDKLPLYDIVDNLSKDFPEIDKYYDTFKEIIYHRNNLIHNYHDVEVDYSKYEKIIDLINIFEKHNVYFVTQNIFSSVIKIKDTIVSSLKEYFIQSSSLKQFDENYLSDFVEDICSELHSHFVSDYYITRSVNGTLDTDFEILQNNYSNRKLVGIDIRTADTKKFKELATAFFKRMANRYLYLFIINYDYKNNLFEVSYLTKGNEIRNVIVKP